MALSYEEMKSQLTMGNGNIIRYADAVDVLLRAFRKTTDSAGELDLSAYDHASGLRELIGETIDQWPAKENEFSNEAMAYLYCSFIESSADDLFCYVKNELDANGNG